MQQSMQMGGSMPVVAPANITTEQIQKYLDENKQLILAILENQNLGKLSECAQYQAQLQKNLLYLAAIADAQPQSPAVRPQMTPPGTMTTGVLPPGMSPQAAAAAAAQYMQQQSHAHIFPPRPQLSMHQEASHLQQTPPHQMMSFPGQMPMRPSMAMNGMHHHPLHVDPTQQSGKPDGTPGPSSEADRERSSGGENEGGGAGDANLTDKA
ncbi:GRF1-interacting factor 3 [Rhynchospora pubera]|uniref:GRF1-interacting factor 3 n=1 Tax=Rhynchospora pubera TaxID=906938 RepID=A0AAV8HF41_9POAL|nr:GRF1-interacting factor 3 [Rhynchospora pubera]